MICHHCGHHTDSAEYLVAHNSHELTAHQLVAARDALVEAHERFAAQKAAIRSQLTDAERIGLAVLKAYRSSTRKTLRIADLVEKETPR